MATISSVTLPSTPAGAEDNDTAIRPFRVNIPEKELVELRRRIAATRWPTKELVEDRSQGVQLAPLKALAHYWATHYDWRKAEARLNAYPQFVTKIDGVDIHFIHVKSRHANAMPMIITHGWPGSYRRAARCHRSAHQSDRPLGGSAGDAFDVVVPSLPGYGFSGEPADLGWDSSRIARAWAVLMGCSRLPALCRPGRRRGRRGNGRHGTPGGQGAHRRPPQPARRGAGHRRSTAVQVRSGTGSAPGARDVQGEWLRRPPRAVHPRHKRSATPCWIHRWASQLGCWTMTRTATTRSLACSSMASVWAISPGTASSTTSRWTLADRHRRLGGPLVLGDRTGRGPGGRPGSSAGQGSRRLHRVSWRDLLGPA